MIRPPRKPVTATLGTPPVRRYSTGVPVVMGSKPQPTVTHPVHTGLTAGQDLADYYKKYTAAHPAAAPGTPAAPAPAAPALPPAAAPTGAYKDSDYFTWKAQRVGDINQQNIAYDAADQSDQTSRQEALRRMAQQRPEDLRKTDESYNNSGLFYSGQLGKARDTVEGDYARNTADTNATYDNRRAAREAARTALSQGYSVEDAAQLAAAADRGVARDADAADANSLVGPADAPVAVAAPLKPALPPAAAAARQRATAQRQHELALARARARRPKPR